MIYLQNAIPLLIFLVISFLAFYFVETVILFALNYYIRKHWAIVVDILLRAVVRHRNMMRIAFFAVISLVVILLFVFTSLADILMSGAGILRLLALILITTMLMIYYVGSQSLKNVIIAKRIHLFVFIILSLFTFTGIMAKAQDGYTIYEDAINKAFVEPIVENIEEQYEQQIEERLFEIFRDKIRNDECEYYDYAKSTGSGFTQFIFIKQDPSLADEDPDIISKGEPLRGKNCVHETKFILTPEGKWYEVLEQRFD